MTKLHEVDIKKPLRTQLTVGMYEVDDKRKALADMGHHRRRDFLEAHPIPAVWGPEEKLYITDPHQLARAAYAESVETGFFWVEADYSKDTPAKF